MLRRLFHQISSEYLTLDCASDMNSFINSALIILLELSVNPSDYTDIAIHFTSYYSKAYAAIEYELEHTIKNRR